MNRAEQRLARIVKKVQTKIGTNFTFFFQEIPEDDALLRIGRTERGTADANSFILYYSTDNISERTDKQLIKDIWHEILHCVTWCLDDIFNRALARIKDKAVRKELKTLFDDNIESVTYFLERSTGQYLFPSVSWKED